MLENCISRDFLLRRLRVGALHQSLDEFTGLLEQKRYAKAYIYRLIIGAEVFNQYLLRIGICHERDITHKHIQRFLKEFLPLYKQEHPLKAANAISALNKIVKLLEKKGISCSPPRKIGLIECILQKYRTYLVEVRKYSPKTFTRNISEAHKLLSLRKQTHINLNLSELSPADIIHLTETLWTGAKSLHGRKVICNCMRIFLRYLLWDRILSRNLVCFVPSIRSWKLSNIPKHLNQTQLKAILETPDISSPVGKRNYAILVLLSMLGLRASEAASLTLDNIDWQKKTVKIFSGKASKELVLPLPNVVLQVLYDYIKNSRPRSEHRNIFLGVKAPYLPTTAGSVSRIASFYIKKSGVSNQNLRMGAHALRHSLAVILINNGFSLKSVADVLGHSDLNSTCIYAKVDLANLRSLAQPFPTYREDNHV